ncbi:MAG: SDR family NAD(P)-dependent oxidoreductase, partial [Spirulina sp. DLM2.Bin59]
MNTLAILGCGYMGTALAQSLQGSGMTITTTTTRADRLPALAAISDRPLQLRGDDPAALATLLADQTTLLVSVAAQGKDYRDSYLATAQTLAQVILIFHKLKKVIYTSSYSV